jgi:hypothetical protein
MQLEQRCSSQRETSDKLSALSACEVNVLRLRLVPNRQFFAT